MIVSRPATGVEVTQSRLNDAGASLRRAAGCARRTTPLLAIGALLA